MEISHQVLSVLSVFALLGGALWVLRRGSFATLRGRFRAGAWGPSQSRPRSLRSVERLALSPQHALHLIEMNGRQMLVAVHPQGCTLLQGRSLLRDEAGPSALPATREMPVTRKMARTRGMAAQREMTGTLGP